MSVVVPEPREDNRLVFGFGFGFVRITLTDDDVARLYLTYHIDHGMPPPALISTTYVPLSIAHVFYPTFVDFPHFASIQSSQLHLNATRMIMALIVLCRRIIWLYFILLRQTRPTLSLWPRKTKVQLFDAPTNKIEWLKRWVTIESKVSFSFHPMKGTKHICRRSCACLGVKPICFLLLNY